MNPQKHIIQKHILEIECNRYELAHDLQKRALSLIYSTLIPLCEEILDRFDLKDAHLKIPEIVLDLGNVPEDRFEEEIIYRYREAFTKQLEHLIRASQNGIQEEVEIRPEAHSILDLWVILLQGGTMPWWGENSWQNFAPGVPLSPNHLFVELWKKSRPALIQSLKSHFREPIFRRRFLDQTKDALLLELSRELSSQGHSFLQKNSKNLPPSLRFLFWEAVLEILLLEDQSIHSRKQDTLRSKILTRLPDQPQIWNYLQENKASTAFWETLIHHLWQNQTPLFRLDFSQHRRILQRLYPVQFASIREAVRELLLVGQEKLPGEIHLEKKIWEAAFEFLWYRKEESWDTALLQKSLRAELARQFDWEEIQETPTKEWQRSSGLAEFIQISGLSPEKEARISFLNSVLPLYSGFMDRTLKIFLHILQENQLTTDTPGQMEAKIWQKTLDYLWNHRKTPFRTRHFLEKMTEIVLQLYPNIPTDTFIELLRTQIPLAHDMKKNISTDTAMSLEDLLRESPEGPEEIPEILKEAGVLPWKALIRRIYAMTHHEESKTLFAEWQEQIVQKLPNMSFVESLKNLEQSSPAIYLHLVYYFMLAGQLPENLPDWILPGQLPENLPSLQPTEQLPENLPGLQPTEQFPEKSDTSIRLLLNEIQKRFPEALKLFFAALSPPEKLLLRRENPEVIHQIMATLNREAQQKKLVSFSESLQKNASRLRFKDPLYIRNAGLVILHPYLSRLFKMLEYTENQSFKSREDAFRAAYLLQFLATKKTEAEEYELAFNKILCGIPLNEIIPAGIELSEREIQTGEGMLKGLVSHWAALKNTDIDNFRVTFLIREGKLSSEDKSWHLHVEEKGFDVLLDYLPWSIGMVRFPWMEKVLLTQWRNE